MSYNTVYQRDVSGKWGSAREVSPSILKPATAAAAEKSRANRAQHAMPVVPSGGKSTFPSGGKTTDRSDRGTGLKTRKGSSKKSGSGHGKYTWGAPGDEDLDLKLSHDDPNYDSMDEEDEEDVIFSVLDHHERMARKAGISIKGLDGSGHISNRPSLSLRASDLPPKIPLAEFKRNCVNLVDEYLVSEDMSELVTGVKDLHSPMLHYEFVRRAVSLGMERRARERYVRFKILYGLKYCS